MSFTSTAITITHQRPNRTALRDSQQRRTCHARGKMDTQGDASGQNRLVPRLIVATCFAGVIKANAGEEGWC